MKKQFRRWGILYDWSKEITSCLPDYYRWNQWLFLRMLEKGLAYKKRAPVNWCPSCRTVLANEQVVDGACERCGTAGRAARPRAVVLPHHRLRRPPARRPRRPRRAGRTRSRRCSATGSAARRAPRSISPLDGARTRRSPSSPPGPTPSTARPSWCSRPEHPLAAQLIAGHPDARGDRGLDREGAQHAAHRARGRETRRRRGGTPARRRSIPRPASRFRSGSPTTSCPTTAAARSWRCRRTTRATSSSRGRRGCRCAWSTARRRRGATPRRSGGADPPRGRDSRLRPSSTACEPGPRRSQRFIALDGEGGLGPRQGHLPAARLADLAPALLGNADPGRLLRRLRRRSGAGRASCRSSCPTTSSSPAAKATRCRVTQAFVERDLPAVRRAGPARDRHDGHLRRQLLVLPALPLAARRRSASSIPRSPTAGRRSTSTSAASSTRSCTCSTRASSAACCTTSAWCRSRSRSRTCSTRG